MQSQILFPKEERLKGELTIPNNSFNTDSINLILDWIQKYNDALNVAENELESIGTEIIYSKTVLPENRRIKQGSQIGSGKFGYFSLFHILKKYKEALKSAEQQIQKMELWK